MSAPYVDLGAVSAYAAAREDGDFGSGTETALKKFQTKYGLGADGVAGKGTWGKLLGQ